MAVNPFPLDVEDTIVDLLFRWLEWRQKLESPRVVRLPEETYRWLVVGGHLVAQPGFCLAASTAPRDPGRLWEFKVAVLELAPEQRRYVEALVVLQSEPFKCLVPEFVR